MQVSKQYIVVTINEALSSTDKSDIKKLIGTELDKRIKRELKKLLADELATALKSKDTKADIGPPPGLGLKIRIDVTGL